MKKSICLLVVALLTTGCSSSLENIKKNEPYLDAVEVKDLPEKLKTATKDKYTKVNSISVKNETFYVIEYSNKQEEKYLNIFKDNISLRVPVEGYVSSCSFRFLKLREGYPLMIYITEFAGGASWNGIIYLYDERLIKGKELLDVGGYNAKMRLEKQENGEYFIKSYKRVEYSGEYQYELKIFKWDNNDFKCVKEEKVQETDVWKAK